MSDLCFGGTPYHLPDTEIEIAGGSGGVHSSKSGDAPSIWVWLIIAGVYMLLVYLTLRLRFRKEADEELVAFVLTHHRLNLNTSCAYTHYGFPLAILIIPFIFVCINNHVVGDEALFFSLSLYGFAFISYRHQRAKLNFEPTATTLTIKQREFDEL